MTRGQKNLIADLLKPGFYLMAAMPSSQVSGYRLYEGNMNPVRKVSYRTARPALSLSKTDRKQRLTLNLSFIRSLRKNTWIKKAYRQYRETGRVNIIQHEKANYRNRGAESGAHKTIAGVQQEQHAANPQQSLF